MLGFACFAPQNTQNKTRGKPHFCPNFASREKSTHRPPELIKFPMSACRPPGMKTRQISPWASRLPHARPASSRSAASAGVSALLAGMRARLRSRTTSVIIHLTRRVTKRRCGAQFDSIGHRSAIFARPRRRTRARSPIATRLFDVHLGLRRTPVVIDLTRRATQRKAALISST